MFSFIFSMKCKNRKSLIEKYLASFENRRFNLFRKKMIRSGRRVLLFFFYMFSLNSLLYSFSSEITRTTRANNFHDHRVKTIQTDSLMFYTILFSHPKKKKR